MDYYLDIKIIQLKILSGRCVHIQTNGNAIDTNEDQAVSLKLMVVLAKAYRSIMDVAATDVRNYDLTLSEFGILEVLYFKGQIPIQQIGGKILITSGTMTYNLDKLEHKGLVERIPSSKDRRVIHAALTETGKTMFERIFPIHATTMEQAMKGLSREQQEEAITLLKLLGKGVLSK